MNFYIRSSLYYIVSDPATILCSLSCVGTGGQVVAKESLSTSRDANWKEMSVGLTHNRFHLVGVETPGDFTISYEATVSTSPQLVEFQEIEEEAIAKLDEDTIPFLFPSRYAPSDEIREEAIQLFGDIQGQFARAMAVEDWLSQNISYVVGASDENSTALNTFGNRSGVCRDFAHLGIAFCRALTIPARYVTVYAHQLEPQDFHAVFEVYIGGLWYLIDGTRKAPLNGMIRIGTGRDASDAAVATLFGGVQGAGIAVETLVSAEEGQAFEGISREDLREQGKALFLG